MIVSESKAKHETGLLAIPELTTLLVKCDILLIKDSQMAYLMKVMNESTQMIYHVARKLTIITVSYHYIRYSFAII